MVSTRPVSWTSPPRDDPAIRDSRIDETSEAAVSVGDVQSVSMIRDERETCIPGFAVAYARMVEGRRPAF